MKHILLFTFFFFGLAMLAGAQYEPPFAEKIPLKTYIHKDTLTDNYFWLRDKYDPQTINYLYANNAYANNKMKESSILQKVLFEEFKSRRKENYDTRPEKVRDYYYYDRVQQDKEYPDIFRKKDSLGNKEQLVLDLNKLAQDFAYFTLGVQAISHNQQYLAYGIDSKGNHVSRLYIKNIDADTVFTRDIIDSVLEFLWSDDNRSFYYTRPEPRTLRSYQVFKHTLGTDIKTDQLIFEEPDKTFQLSLSRSESRKYIFMNISKTKATETWYWADSAEVIPRLFLKRSPGLIYRLSHFTGNTFYVYTNYKAKNYQLMTAGMQAKSPAEWSTVIPHQKNIYLNSFELLKDFMIYSQTSDAEIRIIIANRRTGVTDTFQTGISLGSVAYSFPEYQYDSSHTMRYSVANAITPIHIYEYDLYTHERKFISMDTVLGKFSPEQYETRRLHARAADGVMVPVTISYKKGLVLNGRNPLLLEAYGSYGASSFPNLNATDLSYLNRGFIMATAHIRGGKELGEEWYEEGKMMNKRNTFTDFIACAEYLIKEKYTSPQKLAITGASAGGLLMGSVLNMRPDLFNCAVAGVPFVDVINTMLDESIPLTTFEFEEWGNPKIKAEYDYIKTYSPYDNVMAQAYPNILVTAGYNDAQVGYWEPAKWVSKLREMKTDTNMLLFRTNMDGGHGGASGKYEQLKEQAFTMAFIMKCLGVKENYVTIKGRVVDENNEAVSYTSIYLEGTSTGTSSNINGEFELQVKDLTNTTLVFQNMGFVKQKIKVDMNTRASNLVVKLKSENIQMKAVVVNAKAKDPAYAIIKEAIRRRKENADKVRSYSSDVYMKSNVRLMEIPKKRPAFISKSDMPDSNDLGLIYLSESVARYYTQKPDDYKEEMLASKIAGEKQGFSWNRVRDVFFSLYDPAINLDYYSDRPFVSPIAPLALLSYKYKFKGSFFVDHKEINKIEVIPMRKGDPLFKGHIYIANDDYQVYGSELLLTKDAQIQLVDTVNLLQETININDVWMPLKMQVSSYIKIFGFRATDMSVAAMSNYQLNRVFDRRFFNNETFRIDKYANKKDSQYWGNSRRITLTDEESLHYHKRDSVYKAEHTAAYIDSMTRLDNKPGFGNIFLTGYVYSRKNDSITRYTNFTPLLFGVGYNTVEGPYVNYDIRWSKYELDFEKRTTFGVRLRYGFANTNFAPGIFGYKTLDATNGFAIGYKAGKFIEQYNSAEPIISIVNAGYTLFDRLNLMKILQKEMVSVDLFKELVNGLYGKLSTEYFQREAMVNHTDYAFSKKDKAFSSNNPIAPGNDAPAFAQHRGALIGIAFRYLHRQKYESMPGYKNVLGSKYPEIYFAYRTGLGTSSIQYHYNYMEAGIGKDLELGAFGEFKFDVLGGTFFNIKNMLFADYKHFNGNQTVFLFNPNNLNLAGHEGRRQLTGFHALDYYTYSTNHAFIEAHAAHNFRGLFISKIPVLRKLKAREIAGINMLQTNKLNYNELYFGLANIFSFLRVDAGTASNSVTGAVNWFYRIGLSLNL